jgi:hypothetical protein
VGAPRPEQKRWELVHYAVHPVPTDGPELAANAIAWLLIEGFADLRLFQID